MSSRQVEWALRRLRDSELELAAATLSAGRTVIAASCWVSGERDKSLEADLNHSTNGYLEAPEFVYAFSGTVAAPERAFVVAQDPVARPSDPVLADSKVPFATLDDSVFYWAALTDRESTARALEAAKDWVLCAAVVPHDVRLESELRSGRLTRATLIRLARVTRWLITDAFDGEAYITIQMAS